MKTDGSNEDENTHLDPTLRYLVRESLERAFERGQILEAGTDCGLTSTIPVDLTSLCDSCAASKVANYLIEELEARYGKVRQGHHIGVGKVTADAPSEGS
jgi:hypothetical protein